MLRSWEGAGFPGAAPSVDFIPRIPSILIAGHDAALVAVAFAVAHWHWLSHIPSTLRAADTRLPVENFAHC
jgi:hypothetical protein